MPALDPALAQHDPEAWYPLLGDDAVCFVDREYPDSLGEAYVKMLDVDEHMLRQLVWSTPGGKRVPIALRELVYAVSGPDGPKDLGPYLMWGQVPVVLRVQRIKQLTEKAQSDVDRILRYEFLQKYYNREIVLRYELHFLRDTDREIVASSRNGEDGAIIFGNGVVDDANMVCCCPMVQEDTFCVALREHHRINGNDYYRLRFEAEMRFRFRQNGPAWCYKHVHYCWDDLTEQLRENLGLELEMSAASNVPKLEAIAADKRRAPHVTKDHTLFGSIPIRLYVSLPPSNAKAFLAGKLDAADIWSKTLVVTDDAHPARAAIAEALRAAGYKVDEKHQGSVRSHRRFGSGKARMVKLADVLETSLGAAFKTISVDERVAIFKGREGPLDPPWRNRNWADADEFFRRAKWAVEAARWKLADKDLDEAGRKAVKANLTDYMAKIGATEVLDTLERDYGIPRSTWPTLTVAE